MKDLATTLKAMADETRLQILALLARQGELCVCDFEKVLGVTQSKSSRHLRYLLHAGLVEDRRDGLWVHYRIARNLTPEKRALLKAVNVLVSDDQLGDTLSRLKKCLAAKGKSLAKCCD